MNESERNNILALKEEYEKLRYTVGQETLRDKEYSNAFSWDMGQLEILKKIVKDLEELLK